MVVNYINSLEDFFLGPMRVLYSYSYKNYQRMGYSSKGAKDSAPMANLTAYIWVLGWLTGFARFSFKCLSQFVSIDIEFEKLWFFLMAAVVMFIIYRYLSKRHTEIVDQFEGMHTPDTLDLVLLVLFFCLPSLMLSIIFSKSHFLIVTILLIVIYYAFYSFYFKKRLRLKMGPSTN